MPEKSAEQIIKSISVFAIVTLMVVVLGVVFVGGHIALETFVLYKAWNWLVPPVFGWKPITMLMALVIGTIHAWFTRIQHYQEAKWQTVVCFFAKPLFVLALAWVIKVLFV